MKSLDSFCEKISRKTYTNPINDITDFAGVRVVYLYSSDKEKIEKIIQKEFKIIEKTDKVLSENEDVFGYGALHYLVTLTKKQAGKRYEGLQNLTCEIQVRTVLQDAWAVVAHHLSYKQESDVPKKLRRKLNALSGLFETADDQFENIKTARLNYQIEIEERISKNKGNSLLNEELNIDSLVAFLKSKYPKRNQAHLDDISDLLDDLKNRGYGTLLKLDSMLEKTKEAFEAQEQKYPPIKLPEGGLSIFNVIGVVRTSLMHIDRDYLLMVFSKHESQLSQFREFEDLVNK